MNERMHRYLDGELQRDALTPEEHEDVAQCEQFIRETRQVYRAIEAPDLTARIMAKLPEAGPSNHFAKSFASLHATLEWLTGFVQGGLRWLWTPHPIRLRPVYGVLSIAALFIALALPNIGSRLIPQQAPATRVFVQFRLDAPHASAVRLAGSFTGWKPTYSLQEASSGVWSILIPLKPGVHDYAFIVDGTKWVADPSAPTVDDGFGGVNSRLSVLPPGGDSRL